MAGQVLVNGQRFDKPGMRVPRDAEIRVRGRRRYVSRGGYKLEAALAHFGVLVTGRIVLDSGASTGGFTDCLLQHGARLVYAVEAGHGQLAGSLRADFRVRNLERTNLGDASLVALDPSPSLVTLDLSYLSLAQALPLVAAILAPEGDVLALVKPLFEVESVEARRTGHIADVALLIDVLRRVLESGTRAGLTPVGLVKLALEPRRGVAEYVARFVRGRQAVAINYGDDELLGIVNGPGVGSAAGE